MRKMETVSHPTAGQTFRRLRGRGRARVRPEPHGEDILTQPGLPQTTNRQQELSLKDAPRLGQFQDVNADVTAPDEEKVATTSTATSSPRQSASDAHVNSCTTVSRIETKNQFTAGKTAYKPGRGRAKVRSEPYREDNLSKPGLYNTSSRYRESSTKTASETGQFEDSGADENDKKVMMNRTAKTKPDRSASGTHQKPSLSKPQRARTVFESVAISMINRHLQQNTNERSDATATRSADERKTASQASQPPRPCRSRKSPGLRLKIPAVTFSGNLSASRGGRPEKEATPQPSPPSGESRDGDFTESQEVDVDQSRPLNTAVDTTNRSAAYLEDLSPEVDNIVQLISPDHVFVLDWAAAMETPPPGAPAEAAPHWYL